MPNISLRDNGTNPADIALQDVGGGNATIVSAGGIVTLTGGASQVSSAVVVPSAGAAVTVTGGASAVSSSANITGGGATVNVTGGASNLSSTSVIASTGSAVTVTGGVSSVSTESSHTIQSVGGVVTVTGGSSGVSSSQVVGSTGGIVNITGGASSVGSAAVVPSAGAVVTVTGGASALASAASVSVPGGIVNVTGGASTVEVLHETTVAFFMAHAVVDVNILAAITVDSAVVVRHEPDISLTLWVEGQEMIMLRNGQFDVGDGIRLEVEATQDGVTIPADRLTLRIRDGFGQITTVPGASLLYVPEVDRYRHVYVVQTHGEHIYQWRSVNPFGMEESAFSVRAPRIP